jgi:lysophospholipase L1-like esterase
MPILFEAGNASREPRAYRILCYGDSLTAGFCANGQLFEPYGRSLAEALSEATDGALCEVSVCGLSGSMATEMVANLDDAAARDVCGIAGKGLRAILRDEVVLPDLVLIMAGTNDLGKNRRPEAVLDDLRQLHAVCHSFGVPTVALPPPPAPSQPGTAWDRARRQLHELLAAWARSSEAVAAFISSDELVPATGRGSGMSWDSDGLHLAPPGSQKLGRLLAPLLAPLLQCQNGKEVQHRSDCRMKYSLILGAIDS